MKEATGETSMTLITIVAIAVIGGILVTLWPTIRTWINNELNDLGNCPAGTVRDQSGNCVAQP